MKTNNENLLFSYNRLDESPEHRKIRFLEKLRGKSKRYKRYINSSCALHYGTRRKEDWGNQKEKASKSFEENSGVTHYK